MATENSEIVPDGQGREAVSDVAPKASHKSFRRKYRKIMVKFEEKMRESNTLFREEQKILDISHRLSEQNDRLLEVLYDLNNAPYVSPTFRIDLSLPNSNVEPSMVSEYDTLQTSYDVRTGKSALHRARQAMNAGDMSFSEYQALVNSILRSPSFAPAKSLDRLLKTPSSTRAKTAAHERDSVEPGTSGFPLLLQEGQYLRELDAYVTGTSIMPRPSGTGRTSKAGDRGTERDRDLALQNPVSVYNWLRKNQPQVFLQDNELGSEKQSRHSTSRASKRTAAQVKQEPDLYDEDGIALDPGTGSKGKPKRDDDGGYRPKGGNSRPGKRKREDSAVSARKSKHKLSITPTVP